MIWIAFGLSNVEVQAILTVLKVDQRVVPSNVFGGTTILIVMEQHPAWLLTIKGAELTDQTIIRSLRSSSFRSWCSSPNPNNDRNCRISLEKLEKEGNYFYGNISSGVKCVQIVASCKGSYKTGTKFRLPSDDGLKENDSLSIRLIRKSKVN